MEEPGIKLRFIGSRFYLLAITLCCIIAEKNMHVFKDADIDIPWTLIGDISDQQIAISLYVNWEKCTWTTRIRDVQEHFRGEGTGSY